MARFREAAVSKLGSEFFSSENSFGAPVPVPGRQAEMPSWWEFVQWLISTEGGRTRGEIDQHWRPYRSDCYPQVALFVINIGSSVTSVRFVSCPTTIFCILNTLMMRKEYS